MTSIRAWNGWMRWPGNRNRVLYHRKVLGLSEHNYLSSLYNANVTSVARR